MAKTGENIYKRKDGRWEGRYIKSYGATGGAKYGYVYARTYTEVRQKLAEHRCNANIERSISIRQSEKYETILRAWLQSIRMSIKESSFSKYTQIVETHILPTLGRYPIGRISTQLAESFIQDQMENGRLDGKGGLATKTVADMIIILKESMRYAQDSGIAIICNLNKLAVRKKDSEMRVLSVSEQKTLVNYLLEDLDRCKLGVLIALYTGVRIGELCALRWENLCLDTGTLKVRQTLQRIQDKNAEAHTKTKVIITEPKSKCSVRDIPLPSFLVELVREFEDEPQSYILTGETDRYVEPCTMQNWFKKYLVRCGVKDANFHTTRHTFATRCVEVGFDIKTLSEILGHANVNITLNRYVHSSFELKCANMNKLSLPV